MVTGQPEFPLISRQGSALVSLNLCWRCGCRDGRLRQFAEIAAMGMYTYFKAVLLHHLWMSAEVYQPLRHRKPRATPAAA